MPYHTILCHAIPYRQSRVDLKVPDVADVGLDILAEYHCRYDARSLQLQYNVLIENEHFYLSVVSCYR